MKRKLPIKPNGVCVYVVRTAGGKTEYLLLKRRGTYLDGTWQQVVGGIKQDEPGWKAALREMEEETALPADKVKMYSADVVETYYDIQKDSIYMAPVFVAFAPAVAAVRVSREHTEFCWVSYDEACLLLPFSQQRDALAMIRREFVERTPNELLRVKMEQP